MRLFGLQITRATPPLAPVPIEQSPFAWQTLIPHEPSTGAWQRNLVAPGRHNIAAFSAVYACVSLICGDISKLRLMLMRQGASRTWEEVAADERFGPVLRKPNGYQNRLQFYSYWTASKLLHGNAYALKERDEDGVVRALYMLHPPSVTPLVADDGSVFYRLRRDALSRVEDDDLVVPAAEIIHDRMICLWHPLVGVSPIFACGQSAAQGGAIQDNMEVFFQNQSRPSGILVAPGKISDADAARLKTSWEANFGGRNLGRTAVVGGDMKYHPLTINPVDAQLIEQLGWTVGDVARAFHVPPYKLGLQSNVTFSNAGQADQDYYSQCLQKLIESVELAMDEGLGLPPNLRTEFDLDGLMRMDPAAQADAHAKAIGAGYLAPNEARRKVNLPPTPGGETPYLQQQNWSLAALAQRPPPGAEPAPAPAPADDDDDDPDDGRALLALIERGLEPA